MDLGDVIYNIVQIALICLIAISAALAFFDRIKKK
jgi:hypothetical protein